jgi:ABC-type nitrate/sulfonate/bicarbonate transport system permease component
MKPGARLVDSDAVYIAASILLVLGLWWAIAALGLVPEAVLPTPLATFSDAIAEAESGRLSRHVASSLLRLAGGFAIGAAAGVVLGVLIGGVAVFRAAALPVVEILRPIPPLAWIPLALIWFGIGEGSKIFLIALTSFFPVVVATYRGVRHVDAILIRAARSLDLGGARLLYAVVLPAALPDVVTGLRLGWTLGITILVGAEMIAAPSGLGFMIMDGMNKGRFTIVIFGVLLLGTIGIVSDSAFSRLAASKLLRWHAGIDKSKG